MLASLVRTALLASLLASAGCGGPAGSADAASGGADAGPSAEPLPPAPPALAPCRAGWREVAGDDGVATCDPWPEGGRRRDCGPAQAHFPGTPGCARIGTACPLDGWPADLPTDRTIVYVRAAAAPGGDGRTRDGALASIVAAADAAPFGAVIAIAAGTYDEGEIYVGPGMTLWGACVAETVIGSSAADDSHGVIFLAENGSEARNLRVESPERLGIVVAGTPSQITDVVVHAARNIGVGGFEGTATLDHVLVSGTRGSRGIEVQGSWHATLRAVHVDGSDDIGVAVQGSTARLDAEDLAVTGVLPSPDRMGSAAVVGSGASQIDLSGAVLEGNGEYSVYLDGGAVLGARDVVVRDHLGPDCLSAFLVSSGASAEVSRALVEAQRGAAWVTQELGSRLTVSDVVVRDVPPREVLGFGRAFEVYAGATVVADRVRVTRATDGALVAIDEGSTLDARDVLVSDLRGRATGFGRGVVAQQGGVITLERVRVERAHDVGMLATRGGVITAREASIVEMLGTAAGGDYGMGAWAEVGGRIALTGALIDRARLVGAGAIEAGELSLTRVVVRGTHAAACGDTTCSEHSGGFGLAAAYGGIVAAEDFAVDGAEVCGVIVGEPSAGPSSMDLQRGYITSAPIGACVQAGDYDVARLRVDVEYRDVGIPLQATTYTLPTPLPEM